MERLGDPQTGGETEANHQRMQPFIPIEVVILSGIDQIKSTHPTNDSKGKDERRQFQPSCLRDPSRDRRNPEGETQKEVRCVSKMFGERIEKNDAKRDRRKRERQPIDICSKKNKKGAAEDETNENDVPGRKEMTAPRPRIALIISQSTKRLKSIAAVRAVIIHPRTSSTILRLGRPLADTIRAESAKGRAKTV